RVAGTVCFSPEILHFIAAEGLYRLLRPQLTIAVRMVRSIYHSREYAIGKLEWFILQLQDVGLSLLAYTLDLGGIELRMQYHVREKIEGRISILLESLNTGIGRIT